MYVHVYTMHSVHVGPIVYAHTPCTCTLYMHTIHEQVLYQCILPEVRGRHSRLAGRRQGSCQAVPQMLPRQALALSTSHSLSSPPTSDRPVYTGKWGKCVHHSTLNGQGTSYMCTLYKYTYVQVLVYTCVVCT